MTPVPRPFWHASGTAGLRTPPLDPATRDDGCGSAEGKPGRTAGSTGDRRAETARQHEDARTWRYAAVVVVGGRATNQPEKRKIGSSTLALTTRSLQG